MFGSIIQKPVSNHTILYLILKRHLVLGFVLILLGIVYMLQLIHKTSKFVNSLILTDKKHDITHIVFLNVLMEWEFLIWIKNNEENKCISK